MGKSISSAQKLQQFARFIAPANDGPRRPTQFKPVFNAIPLVSSNPSGPITGSHQLRSDWRRMEAVESSDAQRRKTPLADVVSDCVQRWFQDTLKEAKNGNTAMQVLVGQMYCSGYGVPMDAQRGKSWISRASKSRPSAWKIGDKRPGYNASDSDSGDAKDVASEMRCL